MLPEEIIRRGKERLYGVQLAEPPGGGRNINLDTWVPGLGAAGCGVTFDRNRVALKKYALKIRLLGKNFIPCTKLNIFGTELTTPIMPAPMSGIKTNLRETITEKDFLTAILRGSNTAGTLGMCGDSLDSTNAYIVPEMIKENGGIAVCKPRKNEEIVKRINLLEKVGVRAIGIDIDGLGGIMLFREGLVTRKSRSELLELRKSFAGPMFLKGVMSIEDAQIAYRAGYDAIVVSNHGGRVVDYSAGVADVLPQIAEQFRGKIKIIADGGVRSGYDIFVYLALGAEAVLVGRTILYGVMGGGAEGVKMVLEKLNSELNRAMLFTGSKNLQDIRADRLEKYIE